MLQLAFLTQDRLGPLQNSLSDRDSICDYKRPEALVSCSGKLYFAIPVPDQRANCKNRASILLSVFNNWLSLHPFTDSRYYPLLPGHITRGINSGLTASLLLNQFPLLLLRPPLWFLALLAASLPSVPSFFCRSPFCCLAHLCIQIEHGVDNFSKWEKTGK